MTTDKHLYQDLEDRLRAKDKEGAIEAYYQLLSEGRPLSEIIAAIPSRSGADNPGNVEGDTASGSNKPSLNDPAGRADLIRERATSSDEGEKRSPRPAGVMRARRLAKQTGLFLLPGAAVVAATVSGVVFFHQPRGTLIVRGGSAKTPGQYQTHTKIERGSKTMPPSAFASPLGGKSATDAGSVVIKATGAGTANKAAPAPGVPSIVAAPAGDAPPTGVIAEKRVATSPSVSETKRPAASSDAAEAKPAAAAAGGGRTTGQVIAPVPEPTVTAPALSHEVTAAPPVAPARPSIAPTPKPTVSAPASSKEDAALPQPAPAASHLPTAEIATLLSRGDTFLGNGDVASARLFYQRAADGGDGASALRLGETFDPAFLSQAGMGTILSDPKKAAFWYRRASELGIPDADLLLRNILPIKQQ